MSKGTSPSPPLNVMDASELCIESESDLLIVRKAVREVATALGFGLTDVTRIVTAASELTRNILQYAGRGVMYWRVVSNASGVGLWLVFEDQGPGIAEAIIHEEFTTGNGPGLGLAGTRRLMDEMTIQTAVGKGTRVEVRKWLRK